MRAAFIILLGAIVGGSCQGGHYQSPRQAAILSDTRYLAGDGTFGAEYSQEDGVVFKEESDVNGDRRGSYSYVDPTGQRRTVTYTAGKNGFQATGDHIPSAPPQQAPPQQAPPQHAPPQHAPQYDSPDHQAPSYAVIPQQYMRPYQPDYEPQPAVYRPQHQLQYRPLLQPRYHHPPELQAIPSYASAHSQPRPAPPQYNAVTTPRNFYPPGKLNFNRTPDGFSYSFSKS